MITPKTNYYQLFEIHLSSMNQYTIPLPSCMAKKKLMLSSINTMRQKPWSFGPCWHHKILPIISISTFCEISKPRRLCPCTTTDAESECGKSQLPMSRACRLSNTIQTSWTSIRCFKVILVRIHPTWLVYICISLSYITI